MSTRRRALTALATVALIGAGGSNSLAVAGSIGSAPGPPPQGSSRSPGMSSAPGKPPRKRSSR
jgi:hypothetical protein